MAPVVVPRNQAIINVAFACTLLLLAVLALRDGNNGTYATKTERELDASSGNDSPLRKSKKRDGDGCYHVFLDVGANIGVHGRFLFEPEKYPEAQVARGIFDAEFGRDRDNRDICSFEFEPNPRLAPKLAATSKAYEAMGWRYHVMNVAAGDSEGTMEFHHQNDASDEEWGFSVFKKRGAEGKADVVPTIRLADWIEEHVNKRSIPAPSARRPLPPKVVMKMDIEGGEYVVLPDLILSGALCGIDFMFGEFHDNYAIINQRVPTDTEEQRAAFTQVLKGIIPSSANCKTRLSASDEESYLHDGAPLPEPVKASAKH